MDTITDAAPLAPTIRHEMRFEGSGGEYFKIWIVNLALTIVTLGIFSAWAKVRNKRYFYGNTYIGEHNFDYHGQPLRILLGRVIALVLLLGYTATIHFVPAATFVWALLFLFGAPWLIVSALRFNARNTSYRNIRFNFTGTYGGAFGAYFLWPLLVGITLFTTFPLARRARDRFNINNHVFGGQHFHTEIAGAAMYKIYGIATAMFVGAVAVASMGYLLLKNLSSMLENPIVLVPAMLLGGALYALCALFITTFINTSVFNLVVGNTRLADRFGLESTLEPVDLTWLIFSNLFMTLLTLGL